MKSIITAILFLTCASLAAQTLDNSFNGSGIVLTDYPLAVQSMCLQPDGKIIVAGPADRDGIRLIRYEANGQLDQSFGSQGLLSDDLGEEDVERVYMTMQGSKILVGGKYFDADINGMLFVRRYNEDGSTDETFGSGGTALCTPLSPVDCESPNAHEFNTYDEGVISVYPDGKIQQGGVRSSACGMWEGKFFSVRYTAGGQIDTSFTSNYGAGISESYSNVAVTSMALRSDSFILVGGYGVGYHGTSDSDKIVPRIMTFPYDGYMDIPTASYFKLGLQGAEAFELRAMGYMGENLILAGTITQNGKQKFAVAKLDTPMYSGFIDLRRDSAFGTDGLAIIDVGAGGGELSSLVVEGGKIILAGGANSSGFSGMDMTLIRLNPDGSLDQGFGIGGKVLQDHGNGYDEIYAMKKAGDKLIVAGNSTQGLLDMSTVVMRYAEGTTGIAKAVSVTAAYPNPATEVLRFYAEQGSNWSIADAQGRIVVRGTAELEAAQSISVGTLPVGYYVLHSESSGQRTYARFVKQ